MPKCKLFESWTFRIPRPEPFRDPAYDGARNYGRSRYNTAGAVQKSTLHAPTLRALMAYAALRNAEEKGQDLTDLGAVGHQGTNYSIAEYHSGNRLECVVFNRNTGRFMSSKFEDGTDTPLPVTVGSGASAGSALLFCLMPLLEEEEEFQACFDEFRAHMSADWPDMDAALNVSLTLCDNVYRRIENAKGVGDAAIRVSVPATGNLSTIAQMALDSGTYAPTGVLFGTFTRLLPNTAAVRTPAAAVQDFAGRYALSERTLSPKEESMVPKLADWYIIPGDVIRICEHARMTSGSAQPMRNFLLRGPAGTGKTMSVQAIAAGLHLPYTLLTCNANTEIGDLIGQFIPDTGERTDEFPIPDRMPGIADIIMHPPSVYKELTGIYDETRTEDDVLKKLVEIAAAGLVRKTENGSGRIRYVESPLLQAIRYGYVVELQEVASIMNPGVLVGLNALLDSCQMITLPTGEQVQRHPDTVIVATTNASYEGNRPLNRATRSVLKRYGTD